MNVNKKNNRLMRRLTIADILLTIFVVILDFNYGSLYFFHLLTELAFIFLTWYLIGVLQFAGEAVTIQTPFSIFLGIEVIMFISGALGIGQQTVATASLAFSVLNIVLIVYIALATFRVNNPHFKKAFRFYGISLSIVMLTKLTIAYFSFSTPKPGIGLFSSYIDMATILSLYAILGIVNKTDMLLHENEIQPIA